MSFTNLQIDEAALPQAASLDFKPMAPEYVREVKTQQWITWPPIILVTLLPALLVVKPLALKQTLWFIPLVPLLLASLIVPLVIRQARVKAYALREHDIALRSGVFFRKTVILPLARVQHAEVSEGPLQRRFGLATLKIFTAGGTSVDLQVDGLERARAEELREYILARAGNRERG